ncbi:hypothetical protein TIFTF001_017668 [Ficus carica]|uniref:Uncharacterized protein n=1 Tax=Ficus carica TaxID=3494 RepID=A0AA88DJ29_FICCA|nr:hypothetical protein TIFTF001_017668 [Ficus carica]
MLFRCVQVLEMLSGKAKLKDVSLLMWLKQMAVRTGLDSAQQVGIPIAVAETDTINELNVVNNHDYLSFPDDYLLFQDVQRSLFVIDGLCSHISRQGNMVAHILTGSIFHYSELVWGMEALSFFIASAVRADLAV